MSPPYDKPLAGCSREVGVYGNLVGLIVLTVVDTMLCAVLI